MSKYQMGNSWRPVDKARTLLSGSTSIGHYIPGGVPIVSQVDLDYPAAATAAHENAHYNLSSGTSFGQFMILVGNVETLLRRNLADSHAAVRDLADCGAELVRNSLVPQEAVATLAELNTLLLIYGSDAYWKRLENLFTPYAIMFGAVCRLIELMPEMAIDDPVQHIIDGLACAALDVYLPEQWLTIEGLKSKSVKRYIAKQEFNPDRRFITLLRHATTGRKEFIPDLVLSLRHEIEEWRINMRERERSAWASKANSLSERFRTHVVHFVANERLFPVQSYSAFQDKWTTQRRSLIRSFSAAFSLPEAPLSGDAEVGFRPIEYEETYALAMTRSRGTNTLVEVSELGGWLREIRQRYAGERVVLSAFVFKALGEDDLMDDGLILRAGTYQLEIAALQPTDTDTHLRMLWLKEAARVTNLDPSTMRDFLSSVASEVVVTGLENRSEETDTWNNWIDEVGYPLFVFSPRTSLSALRTVIARYSASPIVVFAGSFAGMGEALIVRGTTTLSHLFLCSQVFSETAKAWLTENDIVWSTTEEERDSLRIALAQWQCTYGSLGSYVEQLFGSR